MFLPTFAPKNAHLSSRYLVTVRDEEAQPKGNAEEPMSLANLKISKHSDARPDLESRCPMDEPDSKGDFTGSRAHAYVSSVPTLFSTPSNGSNSIVTRRELLATAFGPQLTEPCWGVKGQEELVPESSRRREFNTRRKERTWPRHLSLFTVHPPS